MLEEIKNIKSEKSDLRKFGITFGVIFLVIAGFSLFMGLSVPAYFAASIEPKIPGQMLAVYRPTSAAVLQHLNSSLAGIVVAVGSTGMAVAAILGLILDNLVPGTPEQRGLAQPSLFVPAAGDVGEGQED